MSSTIVRSFLLGQEQVFTSRSTAGYKLLPQQNPFNRNFGVPFAFNTSVRYISQQKQRSQQDLSTVKHADIRPFNTAAEDSINAPTSTLPPHLETPVKKEGENTALFYLRKGLAYGRFYKTGIKNAAWVNVKLAQPVLKRFQQDGGLRTAMDSTWLTRSDLQLIRRRTYDFRRIPIIALIFAIAGEWTPFVVIGISGVVPYTCRVPNQITGDRKKLEKRRQTSFGLFLAKTSVGKKARAVDELTWTEMLHCSSSLGLHSRIWPSTLLPLPPSYMIARRLRHHVQYLDIDDMLLMRGGGVSKLNEEELGLALVTRGLKTIDVDVETQRKKLKNWLKLRHEKEKSCYQLWLTPEH